MANEEIVELAVVDEKKRLIGELKLTEVLSLLLGEPRKENSNSKECQLS
jgi:hypothetical protein